MPKVPRRHALEARSQRRQRKEYEREKSTQNGGEETSADPEQLTQQTDRKLKLFVEWASKVGITLHEHVSCTCDGVSANFGMVATDDIKKGENIFVLPRSAILSPENSVIAEFVEENRDKLESGSGWLPLILTLMCEKLNPESKWREYLDTFPNFDDMELPMFWPLSELESELKCTGMVTSVATDIRNMRREFEDILLPLIKEHSHIFKNPRFRDFNFAKEICAFIMAYSFTDDISAYRDLEDEEDNDDEGGQRSATIMVPMADLLNHVPDHNAELNLGESTFRMIAVKDIKKGEEVYNTYGKVSNYTLLLMYGFAVPPLENPHNTVELRLSTIQQACRETEYPDADLRVKYLVKKLSGESAEVDGELESHSICLHAEGLSDSSDILQVLRMDKDELEAKLSLDGDEDSDWMSDDEDEISSEDVRTLDPEVKAVLLRVADLMLDQFPTTGGGGDISLTKKQLYAKYVRESQMLLLRKLKQWVTWYD